MSMNEQSSGNTPNSPPVSDNNTESHEAFWEQRYAGMVKPSGGRPSAVLTRFVADRNPGRALELGCARGDDAIWLAQQGWTVTGVDVSGSALRAARAAAEAACVTERTEFLRHDLEQSLPGGSFDLVAAMFLYSPVPLDRAAVLRRAAAAVSPGGLLLIASHGSRAPWSWASPDTVFPTAQQELSMLALEPEGWRDVFVGPISRQATGPGGQQADVIDAVIAIERRQSV
jgi:SAM-dependent methyltransferase